MEKFIRMKLKSIILKDSKTDKYISPVIDIDTNTSLECIGLNSLKEAKTKVSEFKRFFKDKEYLFNKHNKLLKFNSVYNTTRLNYKDIISK